MKNSYHKVTVAKPCSQDWEEMEKGDGYSFCKSCSKNVIDFTGYSNAEIISLLAGSKSSVCGRLSEMQLNQLNHYLLVKPANRNWMKYLGVLAIGAGIFTQEAKAAVPAVATEISNVTDYKKDDKKPSVVNKVTGRILGPDKKPLAGIRLVILNTKYHALTNQQGEYEIVFKQGLDSKNNTLSVQSLRYSALMTVNYTQVRQKDLVVKDEPMIMGEMIYTPKKGK